MSDSLKNEGLINKPARPVGIVGYGAYIPRYRLPGTEISRIWNGEPSPGPVKEKAVAGLDEDVITMSIEAARNALARSGIDAQSLRAVWVGSESHPYAVKPSGTIVAEAIGASTHIQAGDWQFACKAGTEAARNALARSGIDAQSLRAVWVGSESHPYAVKPSGTIVAEAIGASTHIQAGDWQFACKAGTEAIVAAMGLVGSQMGNYALAIGMDTAQGKPGDALEYTASSGGAAFIIGPKEESLASIDAHYSYVTDTPDFWRRAHQKYPEHGQRFTGEPAYFQHILSCASTLMDGEGLTPEDFKFAVFHQPNEKFPRRVGKQLGFKPEQIETGLLSPVIGNTYAGASIVGLTAILDVAEPGDRILVTSYGSGAGSDAFVITAQESLLERRDAALSTQDYVARRTEIDYATYTRFRGKIAMK